MFEKNKEKMKEKMEPDKVLRFAIVAVILLFLIGALIIGTRMMNPRVDATEETDRTGRCQCSED